MSLKVFGYSERGMLNALFYEMKYSTRGDQLLRDFLGLCEFPFETPKPDFTQVQAATIIIEQSFSDYGDLDVLLLLDDVSGRKRSVFIEAKVKTSQRGSWLITDEWSKFRSAIQHPSGKSDPNLFVQLYRKLQLVRHTRGEKPVADAVSGLWRIGKNSVVLKAVDLLAPYADDARFLALVPDSPEAVSRFYAGELRSFSSSPPTTLPAWDTMRWGYLTWSQVEDHCGQHSADWANTVANFDYNGDQIHGGFKLPPTSAREEGITQPPLPPAHPPALLDICELNGGRRVVIVKPGTNNHRYRHLLNGVVDPISESFLARTDELSFTGEQYHGRVQPAVHERYLYQGREVIVVQGGPERSRVTAADGSGHSFLVFDHELQHIP